MAKGKRQLTPGRVKLARAYAATGSVKAAAAMADMALPSAYQAMHDPGVQEIVKREQLHLLVTVGVPIAVKSLIQVSRDGKNESARNMASKHILDLARMNPEAITEDALDGATIAELQALLERTKDHNAKHAMVIDAEVIEPGALD